MPIFEYKCDDCSHNFEELVSGSDPQINCPKCYSAKVSKQLSTFAASVGSSASSAPMPCGASAPSGCGSGGFT